MKGVSNFLIVAALIAGMVGCVSSPMRYDLTTSSTEGGEISTLGEGTSTFDAGEVVNLVANPGSGYRFVNWTGDVDGIDNVEAASTTIAIYGDYSITANFEATRADQYSLTISSSTGGSVTLPGEGTFACNTGTAVNLVATPDTSYTFVNWTGDVGSIDNVEAASTTIAIYGDYSITANFAAVYDLSISATEGGTVSIPGQGTFSYDHGTVISLVAEAEEGYGFVEWTGNVTDIANVNAATTTITMNRACSITANFQPIPPVRYDLIKASSGGGWVVSPGEGTFGYNAGAVVSLAAIPVYGYQFVNWTGNVGTIANINASSTTIAMNDSYSITATFEAIETGQYSLTISSTPGGSVTTPGEDTYTYDERTVVSLTANPASGYQFVNWTGDVSTMANVDAAITTITMDDDYWITANFEALSPSQYGLTISSTTGGSVTAPGEGTFTCDEGTVVSLVATPATGYQFDSWTGNVGTIASINAASTTITMNDSYSIQAVFSEEPSSPPGISYTEAEAEASIIALVNAERQQFGWPTLSQDFLLTSLAREHSTSMVENNFFGHERYPGERSLSYNQPPGTIRGENLAMIPTRSTIPGPYLSLQEVCEWAVSAWMSSSGHRSNILEPRYTKTGVGVSFSEGAEYLYITQIFEGNY